MQREPPGTPGRAVARPNLMMRRPNDGAPKDARSDHSEHAFTSVGMLIIKINDVHLKPDADKTFNIFCEFNVGRNRVFSRTVSANGRQGEECVLVFDETFNIIINFPIPELQVVAYSTTMDVDKMVGHLAMPLMELGPVEELEHAMILSETKDAYVNLTIKYFSLLSPEELKQYSEHYSTLSEETFLQLFKRDRLGFQMSEWDVKDYSNFAKRGLLMRNVSKKKYQAIRSSKDLKQIARKGLPMAHRAELWLTLSKAKEKKAENAGMYWRLLEVHKNETSAHIPQIHKDLERTFPGHRLYSDKKGLASMQRVLTAYSWKNMSIGYCQSMNFISGFLLLFMDEEAAFWLLSTIVEELVPDYYAPIMIGAKADHMVFCQLVEKKLPAIHGHLTKLGVPYRIEQATMQWFLSLFIDQLPNETTLRVFDAFFSEGATVLLRVGLAILKMRERQILACPDYESCWGLLKKITKTIYDADALMRIAFNDLGSFKELKIESRRGEAIRQINDKGAHADFQTFKKLFRYETGNQLQELRDKILLKTPESHGTYKLTFDTLFDALTAINSGYDHQRIKSLFRLFDSDTKGVVDLYDVICGLSLVFNGVPVHMMLICFEVFDTDKDGKLDNKELQHFLAVHYKWLRRTLKGSIDWHVDAAVTHDIELLWKKVRPYVDERGGKLDFAEFRFRVAKELEPLDQWLSSEPREAPPPIVAKSAAQILEEERRERLRAKEEEGEKTDGEGPCKEERSEAEELHAVPRENKVKTRIIYEGTPDRYRKERPKAVYTKQGSHSGISEPGRLMRSGGGPTPDTFSALMKRSANPPTANKEEEKAKLSKSTKEREKKKKRWGTKRKGKDDLALPATNGWQEKLRRGGSAIKIQGGGIIGPSSNTSTEE